MHSIWKVLSDYHTSVSPLLTLSQMGRENFLIERFATLKML